MEHKTVTKHIKNVVDNTPADWLNLTTFRLDIYNESLAKTEFLEKFDALVQANELSKEQLALLPTAYDYVRLGHPLSSVLEWSIAQLNNLDPKAVISFSSRTMPLMAVLRTNALANKKTRIYYTDELPIQFDETVVREVYGYTFELIAITDTAEIEAFDGSVILLQQATTTFGTLPKLQHVDFIVQTHKEWGSVIAVLNTTDPTYIGAIQHVRRRESIAMTPANCYAALSFLVDGSYTPDAATVRYHEYKEMVIQTIKAITATDSVVSIGSSGLSIQYAIMMGLIHEAHKQYPTKKVNIIVPPNCYGGTNDQARRIADAIPHVEVLDMPVDGNHNMVQSIAKVLDTVAKNDAVPLIIAEIPTNPRVEVPNLDDLQVALSTPRKTESGATAVEPVFILDQTFCPNVQFLSEKGHFSSIQTISYVSGSKFPSGGKCTAGYCVGNQKAAPLMKTIAAHLTLCDNEATALQVHWLAVQLPSMNQRIVEAYQNTREFVQFIAETLPEATLNFVSDELAEQGFMPSVFSLDLPTKGANAQEREAYKRELNHKLITAMIEKIPNESKYCVSYGQLKGCYWTIPATSTQGTTKEEDKDYIARVALSPELDLDLHKAVFKTFCEEHFKVAHQE